MNLFLAILLQYGSPRKVNHFLSIDTVIKTYACPPLLKLFFLTFLVSTVITFSGVMNIKTLQNTISVYYNLCFTLTQVLHTHKIYFTLPGCGFFVCLVGWLAGWLVFCLFCFAFRQGLIM